jgi:DNA modification methylase
MEVNEVNIDSLKVYEKNARTHSEKQLVQLVASLKEFGWTNPLLVDETLTIIAGHGRLAAAKKIGMQKVPVIELSGMTEAQKRAYVLADNKLAELAGWDKDLLTSELAALQDMDFDIELTGFSDVEIAELLPVFIEQGGTDENEIPDPPAQPTTIEGDVWVCGRHRLKCGDSTSAQDMASLMAGGKADMVFTDPPYNVDYQGGTKDGLKIKNDSMSSASFYQFLFDVFSTAATVVEGGAPIYVCHSDSEGLNFRKSMLDAGWLLKSCLIWVKSQFVLGRLDYHQKHEPILYGWKDGAAHKWYGGRTKHSVSEDIPGVTIQNVEDGYEITFGDVIQHCKIKVPAYEMLCAGSDELTSVWRVEKPQRSEFHPTTKPVEIPRRAINNSSKVGGVVLDMFLGSGSTMIACEQIGRACRGLELDPVYCDVIVQRWQSFTGATAILESTGDDFNAIRSARQLS